MLTDISDLEFGEWYLSLTKGIQEDLEVTGSKVFNLSTIESKVILHLNSIRDKLLSYTDKDILAQHKTTANLSPEDYERQKEYSLPCFVIKKSLPNGSGVSIYNQEIPVMLIREGESDDVLYHETQHWLYQLLTNEGQVPIDTSQDYKDQVDFWMYKNELLSKIIGKQKPIGYTKNMLNGSIKDQSDSTSKYVSMLYHSYAYCLNANSKKAANDFIKGTFLSKNFSKLFHNTVDTASGGKIRKYQFENIQFANSEYEKYFLDNIEIDSSSNSSNPELVSANPFTIIV